MHPARRIGRLVLIGVLWVVALVGVAITAGLLYLNTDSGAARIAKLVSGMASSGQSGLKIGSIRLAGLGRITIRDIVLTDAQGEWARIGQVAVRWHPGEALGGRVHVETVGVRDVRVARKPVAAPKQQESKGFSLPHIPTAIRIDDLTVAPVVLAQPVLGEAIQARIDGSLGAKKSDQSVVTHALVQRLDRPGRIALDVFYQPARPALKIGLAVEEPEGGLVARLAKLPGAPPVSIHLAGDGPLENWRGSLQADLPRLVQLRGDLAGDWIAPGRVQGALNAQFGPLMPAKVTEGLGQSADVTFALALNPDQVFGLEALKIATPAVTVSAQGRIDRARKRIEDFRLTASVRDAARLQPYLGSAKLGAVEVTAHLDGPFDAPETRLDVTARDVTVPGLGAIPTLTAQANLIPPIGADAPAETPLTLSLKATNPALTQAALDDLVGDALELAAKATWNRRSGVVRLADLRLKGRAIEAQGSGTFGTLDKAVDARLTLSAGPMAVSGPKATAGVKGRARAQLVVQGALTKALTADLTARGENLTLPSPPATALLGPSPEVTVRFERRADGAMALPTLHVQGAHLALESQDCAIGETVRCRVQGRIDSLAPVGRAMGKPLAGSVTLDIAASGARANPTLTVALAARDGRAGTMEFQRLAADLKVENPTGDAQGNVALTLAAPAGMARAASDFRLTDKREVIRLSNLTLSGPGLEGGGDLTVRIKQKLAQGALDLRVRDAGRLAALVGQKAAGQIQAHVALSSGGGKQDAQATVGVNSLVLRTGPNTVYTANALDLRAAARNLFGPAPNLSASVQGREIAAAGTRLNQLSASAQGTMKDLAVQASASGQAMSGGGPKPLSLALAGQVGRNGDETTIRLSRFAGKALGIPFSLRGPARIALAKGGVAVDRLMLGIEQGTVAVSGHASGQAVALDLSIQALPAHLMSIARPDFDFAGQIDGTGTIRTSPGSGSGRIRIEIAGLRPKAVGAQAAQLGPMPTVSGRIDGTWDGRRAQVSATLSGFSQADMRLRADLPLAVMPNSAVPQLVRTAPVSAHLGWNGPVAPIWAFVPMVEHRLRGNAAVVADVSGTIAAPQVSATARLTNGRYEHLVWGTVIGDMALTAQVRTGQSAVVRMTGTDGGRGTIKVDATVQLDPARGNLINATVDFRNFTFARSNQVTGSADGHITANGPAATARIAGLITTDRVNAYIGSSLPPSVVTLDVVPVNGPPHNPLPQPDTGPGTLVVQSGFAPAPAPVPASPAGTGAGENQKTAKSAGMELDIHIRMPNNVFVRGRGLEAEWKGNLHVRGTSSQPRIFGQLELMRGDFSLAGKTIKLDSGTIAFAGTNTVDPSIDISAVYTETALTATLHVTGRASKPKIELTSVPDMPQDEVLSHILFGKSTASLTPFEAVQLAQGLAELSGITGSGPGLMDKMRTSLGLDVLRIQKNDEGATTVGAGKYVSKRVYVGVQQGLQASSSAVTVNVDLTKNLSVETNVGATAQSRVGVNWKWDY